MSTPGPFLTIVAAMIFLLVLSPLAIVFILAFSADSFMVFPPSGYSFRWFGQLLGNEQLLGALWLSLKIAPIVTVISVCIGTSAAMAISKLTFVGRDFLRGFFLAPLLLPALVLGLALLTFLTGLRLSGTVTALVLGHLVVTVPFVIRLMTSAFASLPDEVEAAAATLGASTSRVVFRVTLPLAMPGLIASAALSFLLSFDETVISLFLVGPQTTTLPVEMMNYVQGRTDPLIAALSAVVIVGTLSIVLVVERLVGLARAVGTGGA